MTQITFRVDVRQATQAGHSCPIPPVVYLEIDPALLSQEERDLVAARIRDDGLIQARRDDGVWLGRSPAGSWAAGDTPVAVTAAAPTLEALLAELRRSEEAIAGHGARQAAAEAALAEERRQVSLARLHVPHTAERTRYLYLSDTGAIDDRDYDRYMRSEETAQGSYSYLHEWAQHLPDEAVRDSAEARANDAAWARATQERREAAREVAERKLRQGDIERRQWIATHGSRRLQRLLAEGISHQATYVRERAAWDAAQLKARLDAERPGWTATTAADVDYSVADVSDRTLALLDAARAMAPAARLAKLRSTGRYVAVEDFSGHLIYWPRD